MRRDHQMHLIAGLCVSSLVLIFGGAWWLVLVLALVAGVGKEVYDYFFGGTVEASDVFWTVAGAVPVALVMWGVG